MDSDTPLKVAFQVRTADLLPLTDDAGAQVVSALAVELSAGKRTVDLVLRLRRGGEEYLRPPAPRELVYRHVLGGRVVNQWRFGVVRLWEQSPKRLLALGPGGAALVPLSSGASLPLVAEASRRIQLDAPVGQRPDLLAILQVFAEGRYTATQLARVIPEEVAMASGLFEKVLLKGRTEGRTEEARRICVDLVKALHPAVALRGVPGIEGCSELTRLRRWALRAPRVSDVEFARLVTGGGISRSSRRRAPQPARRFSRPGKASRDR